MRIIVPPLDDRQHPGVAGLRAEVSEMAFASGAIRPDIRVKSLSDEARQLIDSRKPG